MFSGLIESLGTIATVDTIPEGIRLGVRTPVAPELALGESIAVNGVCLTVVERDETEFRAELSPETARVTTLGGVRPNAVVNLERSLRVDARLGGHFVLGHVDGIGRIVQVQKQSDFYLVTVGYDRSLSAYFVPKGSVAVDGISLTVAALREETFDVQIVPYTWDHTTLHASPPETPVNLECDIIGKYVVKAVRETA